jgi:hypothetical protein
MPLPDIDTALDWRGRTVVDRDGEKIGKLGELYLDEETSRPEWAGIAIGTLGRRQALVPLSEAQLVEEDVRLPFDKEHVENAPRVDPDETLSQEEEASLYRHYGLDYSTSGTVLPEEETGGAAAGARQGGAAGAARPEGQAAPAGEGSSALEVGTEVRPRERLRLKKYVVTEHVTKKVPVSREEVRLEREPVGPEEHRTGEGGRIEEDEQEVVLREEEPVFDEGDERR